MSSLQFAKTNNESSLHQASDGSSVNSGGSGSSGGRGRGRGRGGRGRGRGRGRGYGRSSGRYQYGRGSGCTPVPSSGEAAVCHFFRQGRCNAGTSCRFRHTQEAAQEAKIYLQSGGAGGSGYQGSVPSDTSYNPYAGGSNPSLSASGFRNKRRPYCPMKASAVHLATALQDEEPRPWTDLEGPFFSIDVECIASGCGHVSQGPNSHRIPARVAMVDSDGQTLLDETIKILPDVHVTSYLTPLTGLTQEMCHNPDNKSLEEVVDKIKQLMPQDAVLVGQGIQHDIDWLNLVQGEHFRDTVDITDVFRQRLAPNSNLLPFAELAIASVESSLIENLQKPQDENQEDAKAQELIDSKMNVKLCAETLLVSINEFNNDQDEKLSADDADNTTIINTTIINNNANIDTLYQKYRIFSLRHTCRNLLGIDMQEAHHDPTHDARYSLMLFLKYRTQTASMLRATRDSLHRATPTPSFATVTPLIDGVCLGRDSYRIKWTARFIWKWWVKFGRRGL